MKELNESMRDKLAKVLGLKSDDEAFILIADNEHTMVQIQNKTPHNILSILENVTDNITAQYGGNTRISPEIDALAGILGFPSQQEFSDLMMKHDGDVDAVMSEINEKLVAEGRESIPDECQCDDCKHERGEDIIN
jgi:hypothetical protein